MSSCGFPEAASVRQCSSGKSKWQLRLFLDGRIHLLSFHRRMSVL